ncbi:MAG TPA: hypothetical protein VMF10_11800 [Candidatus Aquilonibacter sp.]|nr:hypothetical protein [Candidatus Aquilonibacter sp.]
MTTDQETILAFLSDHIATLTHKLDSTLQVVRGVPDWEMKIQTALSDPSRIQTTDEKLKPIQRLFDGYRLGVLDSEEWLLMLSEAQATVD